MIEVAQTSVRGVMSGIVERLQDRRQHGAIIGPAAIGKTTTAAHLASIKPMTHLFTARESFRQKPTALWQEIAWALGILAESNVYETQSMLCQHNWRGHVLIVDEAQKLPPVQMDEILKSIGDEHAPGRISVVLVGNPDTLHHSRGRKAAWDQIETRLAILHCLEGFIDGDGEALARAQGVTDREALAILETVGSRHAARGVMHVIETARDIAGDGAAINGPIIRKALQEAPKYRPIGRDKSGPRPASQTEGANAKHRRTDSAA